MPVLVIDEKTTLVESGAILCYLAEGTPLLPDDRLERAQVLQWMFFEHYSHEPNVAVARFILQFLKQPGAPRLPERIAGSYRALDNGAASRDAHVFRRRALHHRGYRAVRLYARRP
ncbi:Glutathione S-transferase subgroup [Candidatus Paraburkholderia kirkii]|nr:Glutathione S-transferase subgroup [Candidatus Paraburkholderia kirkii]